MIDYNQDFNQQTQMIINSNFYKRQYGRMNFEISLKSITHIQVKKFERPEVKSEESRHSQNIFSDEPFKGELTISSSHSQ